MLLKLGQRRLFWLPLWYLLAVAASLAVSLLAVAGTLVLPGWFPVVVCLLVVVPPYFVMWTFSRSGDDVTIWSPRTRGINFAAEKLRFTARSVYRGGSATWYVELRSGDSPALANLTTWSAWGAARVMRRASTVLGLPAELPDASKSLRVVLLITLPLVTVIALGVGGGLYSHLARRSAPATLRISLYPGGEAQLDGVALTFRRSAKGKRTKKTELKLGERRITYRAETSDQWREVTFLAEAHATYRLQVNFSSGEAKLMRVGPPAGVGEGWSRQVPH